MNCPNCAAAMQLVESRRYFQCRHCGTFGFPEGDVDGIRVIGTTTDAAACPVCKVTMAHAVIDNSPIDLCSKCRGILLTRTTFADVISKRRAWASTTPVEPLPLDRKELPRELSCPRCSRRFDTYPHYGPGNVVIDNCTQCDLIWLDFGEMRQIVDAPGRDRGGRHVPMSDEGVLGRPSGPEEARAAARPKDPFTLLLDALFGD